MNIRHRLVPGYGDDFYARFPLIFSDVLGEKRESVSPFTDWGIECGVGWRGLLEDLFSTLEKAVKAKPKRECGDYRVTQCKQKFGSLRVYMSKLDPYMSAAIDDAVSRSLETCESCGSAGSPTRDSPWIRVSCARPKCSRKPKST